MSFATINLAANDPQLRARVDAAAQKAARTDATLGETLYGQQLLTGLTPPGQPMPLGGSQPLPPSPLMWGVAVDTEDIYELALANGNGSPGHDATVITDEVIFDSVVANWPPDSTTVMPTRMPYSPPPPS